MKKNCDLGLYPPRWLKNFLKVMRITGILCLVCVMHLSAAVHSQTARINLKMKDATIEQVLNKNSESTQLDFFYSNSKIDVSKRFNSGVSNSTTSSEIFKFCFTSSRSTHSRLFFKNVKQALRTATNK